MIALDQSPPHDYGERVKAASAGESSLAVARKQRTGEGRRVLLPGRLRKASMRRMRTLFLTQAVVVFVTAAIPSMASAAGWDFDVQTGTLPLKFTIMGGEAKFTQASGGGTIACQKIDGSGEYTTPTEGTLDFTFTGCKRDGFEECHSKGANAEEVTTTTLVFHNIMIDSTVQVTNGKPGILITGNNNHFATLICKAGNVELIGNGVIGENVNLLCSNAEWKKTATIDFSSTSVGQQTYKQIETTGTVFDLTYRTGASSATASIDAKPVFEYDREIKTTCP
jgi:hypothetical protein